MQILTANSFVMIIKLIIELNLHQASKGDEGNQLDLKRTLQLTNQAAASSSFFWKKKGMKKPNAWFNFATN